MDTFDASHGTGRVQRSHNARIAVRAAFPSVLLCTGVIRIPLLHHLLHEIRVSNQCPDRIMPKATISTSMCTGRIPIGSTAQDLAICTKANPSSSAPSMVDRFETPPSRHTGIDVTAFNTARAYPLKNASRYGVDGTYAQPKHNSAAFLGQLGVACTISHNGTSPSSIPKPDRLTVPPLSTSASAPCVSKARAVSRTSGREVSNIRGSASVTFILTRTVKSVPTADRMLSSTRRGKRRRLVMLPPYSSVRVFVNGHKNCDNKYPCPQCSSTASNPAAFASSAAFTNAVSTRSISSAFIARGQSNPAGLKTSPEGATCCFPDTVRSAKAPACVS
eukprot:m.1103381 g.1103381  ORF g.1103381 m.1103381 type:complete len:333 (-) comp24331_c2_seq12:729-1727(-)